jgi:hypothetical protein
LLDLQDWADEGIIRVVFVTSPGKFISTIEGELSVFYKNGAEMSALFFVFMLW